MREPPISGHYMVRSEAALVTIPATEHAQVTPFAFLATASALATWKTRRLLMRRPLFFQRSHSAKAWFDLIEIEGR